MKKMKYGKKSSGAMKGINKTSYHLCTKGGKKKSSTYMGVNKPKGFES